MKLSQLAVGCMVVWACFTATSDAAILTLGNARATYYQGPISGNSHVYHPAEAIDGTLSGDNGWSVGLSGSDAKPATAIFDVLSPVPYQDGTTFTFTLTQVFGGNRLLGYFRFSVTDDANPDYDSDWQYLTIDSMSATGGMELTQIDPIGGIFATWLVASPPNTSVYTIVATSLLSNITAIRLEALPHPDLPSGGPGTRAANGNFVLTELQVDAAATTPEPASLVLWGVGAIGSFVAYRRRRK